MKRITAIFDSTQLHIVDSSGIPILQASLNGMPIDSAIQWLKKRRVQLLPTATVNTYTVKIVHSPNIFIAAVQFLYQHFISTKTFLSVALDEALGEPPTS